jgi:hypothetical protein
VPQEETTTGMAPGRSWPGAGHGIGIGLNGQTGRELNIYRLKRFVVFRAFARFAAYRMRGPRLGRGVIASAAGEVRQIV